MPSDLLNVFSKNYLENEPVPDDLAKLLEHSEKFLEITGIRLLLDANERPWNDTSYLSPQELENPDLASNVRAMAETNELIAFFAVSEDHEFYGFWRGPEKRSIADSPLVWLDNEGQYAVLEAPTFATGLVAHLSWNEDLKSFLEQIGLEIPETIPNSAWPDGLVTPETFCDALCKLYLNESRS